MSTYMPNFMNLEQIEIGILIKLSCFEGKSRVFMGGGNFFWGRGTWAILRTYMGREYI